MKIDFSYISSPVLSEDRDHITGKIGDQDVEVFRRMNHWTVELGVKIDGIVLHLSTPNETEKDAFSELYERAFSLMSRAHEAKRDAVGKSNAFKKVFRNK